MFYIPQNSLIAIDSRFFNNKNIFIFSGSLSFDPQHIKEYEVEYNNKVGADILESEQGGFGILKLNARSIAQPIYKEIDEEKNIYKKISKLLKSDFKNETFYNFYIKNLINITSNFC